jgi:hypothetical protein
MGRAVVKVDEVTDHRRPGLALAQRCHRRWLTPGPGRRRVTLGACPLDDKATVCVACTGLGGPLPPRPTLERNHA